MVDWAKRITKAAGDELGEGERVVAGTVFQKTGLTGQMTGIAVGGLIGAGVASKLQKSDDGELVSDRGIAATVPDGPLVVGLTSDDQVLMYEQGGMSGKPKELAVTLARADVQAIEVEEELAVTLARADVQAIEVEEGKVTKKVMVVFADGTAKMFETPRIDKSVDRFVEALG
jgi:hypothetical protein